MFPPCSMPSFAITYSLSWRLWTLDLSAVVRSDITIYTTRGEGGNNVKRAVSLAAQGRLRGAELVTHEFPLEEIAEALRVMRERIGDPIKIVIIP